MFMFRINSCINKRCMLESELAYKNRQILSKSQMLRGQKVAKGLQEKDVTHERSVQSRRQLLSSNKNKSLKKGLNKICIRFNGIWTTFKSDLFSRLSFMLNFQPLFVKWARASPLKRGLDAWSCYCWFLVIKQLPAHIKQSVYIIFPGAHLKNSRCKGVVYCGLWLCFGAC